MDLVVERVNRGGPAPVWLFSRTTLEAIPDVYDEVDLVAVDRFLPSFLTRPRVAGIRLFAWLMVLLIVPVGYQLTGLLGRLFRPFIAVWRRRHGRPGETPANVVHGSVRLLLLAVLIRWLLGHIQIRLPERVFWSGIATSLTVGGVVWLLLLLNGAAERSIYRRVQAAGHSEVASMLRLARRLADAVAIAAGVLVMLYFVGIDPTAALAGLGIGGIAVALAAQKTLENVIGGVSIIFDQAVRVGDFLKLGETVGTVDDIGLRSTRIRTMDRTIVSVPNGQIANVNIETLSARDKFWFHHFVGLGYEASAGQMRSVIDGIRTCLASHPMVDRSEPIRARFIRFGPFSLDIEIFAYVVASDWGAFLETQRNCCSKSWTSSSGPGPRSHFRRRRCTGRWVKEGQRRRRRFQANLRTMQRGLPKPTSRRARAFQVTCSGLRDGFRMFVAGLLIMPAACPPRIRRRRVNPSGRRRSPGGSTASIRSRARWSKDDRGPGPQPVVGPG
jgi:MscS family membrane protein